MTETEDEINGLDNQQYLFKSVKLLYLDSETADVHFLIDSYRIPAHKSLLGAASNVFKTLLYGPLKHQGDVQLNEISTVAFKAFLRFFYFDKVDSKVTSENIVEVLRLGHKYNAIGCVETCFQLLKDTMGSENICIGIHLGILYGRDDLLELYKTYLTTNTEAVLKSTQFLECDKRVMQYILRMDVLSCSESELFEACMSWFKSGCKGKVLTRESIVNQLPDFFHDIRFKSMSMEDFFALTDEYESVLSQDFRTISKLIIEPDFHVDGFNKELRMAVAWDEDEIIECKMGHEDDGRLYELDVIEVTKFSTNEPLLLGGFSCHEIVDENSEYLDSDLPISVVICEAANGKDEKVLLEMKTLLKWQRVDVVLPTPVFIKPRICHKICLAKFPDKFKVFSHRLMKEVEIAAGIKIKFNTKYDIGPISSLNFNRI